MPTSSTPILITGATGFIGEHLFRRLAAENQLVVGTGCQHTILAPCAAVVQLDMRKREAVDKLVGDLCPSVIFHCAAETNAAYCQQHPQTARGSIVNATRHLAQMVNTHVPEAVVVALSTDLVFDGESSPYLESDPTGAISVYGQLKLEAEKHVIALPRGLVLRTSLVYGERTTHRNSFLAWMVDTLSRGEPLPLFEDEVRTPIDVADLCWAMIAMAQSDRSGLWHVGGPQRLDRVAMGRDVCGAFGLDPDLIAPTRLADSTYPAPRPRDVSLDSSRLWTLLKRDPIPFRQGVEKLAKLRETNINAEDYC